jgi:hypothetical protein
VRSAHYTATHTRRFGSGGSAGRFVLTRASEVTQAQQSRRGGHHDGFAFVPNPMPCMPRSVGWLSDRGGMPQSGPRKNSTAPNVRLFGATPGAPERCPPIMSPFMYRCPDTGLRVPSFESTKTSDGTYDVVTCVACGRVHLIDPATGKVLGQDKERAASFTGGCAVGRMFSVGVKKPRRRARLSDQRAEMPMPTDKV